MNKKKIERKIADGFRGVTPDIYNRIQSDCDGMQVNRVRVAKSSNGRNLFWKLSTCVLALILVVTAVVGGISFGNEYAQAAVVALDVNPSVEIKLNKNNRVVAVKPLNEDGEIIVSGMDFGGCQLKVAVNALIGSMLRNGYLSEFANSVLVSVDSNENVYKTIADTVAEEITLTLGQMSIDASVVKQWIVSDDAVSKIAADNDISTGKAQLVYKIASQTEYTVEQLAELSINELSLLLNSNNIEDDNLDQTGEASSKEYKSASEALQIALNATGVEGLTAESEGLKVIENKIEFDDGYMVYEAEFVYSGYVYEAEIGAASGKVVAFEKELMGAYTPATEVIADADVAKSVALDLADIKVDKTEDIFATEDRYYRNKVYYVFFRTADAYYEFNLGSDGTILYACFEALSFNGEDSYLTRRQLEDWFVANNTDGITRLDTLERMRVTSEKTVDGRLVYTLTFVKDEVLHTYKIDAVNKQIISHDVTEYETAVKEDIKDKLHGMFGFDDFDFIGWNGWNWNEWNWDDDDYELKFEYGGHRYEVEIDRWGNVKYDRDEPDFDDDFNYDFDDDDDDDDEITDETILEKIKEALASYMRADVKDITIESVEIEVERGITCYEVEFWYKGRDYEEHVSVDTYEVIDPAAPPAHHFKR
ncbi:MAG: PepSY domain-containing protein [Firmicutes bacterium]|nr:PepSY domain-containing protein [Bacillota bacterium]